MRGFPSALTKQAARAMWESLPTDIQTKIIDLVDIEREMVTGVVKPNALGPRLANKMFARELKYQVDLRQAKDPERFVRTALEQARLRITRGRDACTARFKMSIYLGVYFLCTTPVTRPPSRNEALYEALLKELPRELPLVSPQHHKGFLHIVANAFKYLDRFYVKIHSLPALKTSFRKIRRRLCADYRRLLRRISLVLLTNLAEVRAAAAL